MIACHQQKTLALAHYIFPFISSTNIIVSPSIESFLWVPVIHLSHPRNKRLMWRWVWAGRRCTCLVWWLIILLIPTQSVNLNWLAFDYCNIKHPRCVVGGYASADGCLSVSSSCMSSIVRLDPVPNTMCDTNSGCGDEYRGAHCSSTIDMKDGHL